MGEQLTWTQIDDGRWTRSGGYLLRTDGGHLVELHRYAGTATTHVYAPGADPRLPAGLTPAPTGGPLDDHHAVDTTDRPDLAEVDDDAVWAALAKVKAPTRG